MATSAGGLPYVEASDLVSGYPAVSQSLAETLDTKLALKAALASPTFTGTPVLPAATTVNGDSSFTAWASHTATVAQMTIGNGTISTVWKRIGKTVFYRGTVTFGSTTAMHASNAPTISLPVNALNTGPSTLGMAGITHFFDTSAGKRYPGVMLMAETYGLLYMNVRQAADDTITVYSLTTAVPPTVGTGDVLHFSIVYEGA